MKKTVFILAGILVIHLFLLANLQFTAWPEMFSYPYLKNSGFLLYKDMIHAYPPLLTTTLSYIYSVFGYKVEVLKIVTWIIILTIDFLIFLIVKELSKSDKNALLAVFLFALLQPFLEGNMLWFDLAFTPFILAGSFFVFKYLKNKPRQELVFMGGFFLAVALLIKQLAGVFLIFSILYLALIKKRKEILYILIGPVILGLLLLLYLVQTNQLAGFINWTIYYPATFWSKFPQNAPVVPRFEEIIVILLLMVPPAVALYKKKSLFKKREVQFLLLMLFASFLTAYPRFSFFHFQVGLAFIAILVGFLFEKLDKKGDWLLFSLLLFSVIVLPTVGKNWRAPTRFFAQKDIKLAEEIKKNPEENIFLLGVHSAIYVYSNKLPPKPWADKFPWIFEYPGIQEWLISSWEKDPPGTIYWNQSGYQPARLVEYIRANYTKSQEVQDIEIWQKNTR